MLRVWGVNLVAALAAGVLMFFIGYLFYGVIFQEVWSQQLLENHGVVAIGQGGSLSGEALTEAVASIPQQLDMGMAMGLGFVLTLVMAFAIGAVLTLSHASSMGEALGRGGLLWLGFAVPVLSYNVIYYAESTTNFGIDLLHTFVIILVGAAVIYAIDGRAIRGEQVEAAANEV